MVKKKRTPKKAEKMVAKDEQVAAKILAGLNRVHQRIKKY